MYRAAELEATKKNYALIDQATKQAAKINKVLPHEFQAVVWSVIRK